VVVVEFNVDDFIAKHQTEDLEAQFSWEFGEEQAVFGAFSAN
jgi:hypothetical protein